MNTLLLSINNTFSIAVTSDTPFTFSETDLLVLQAHVPGVHVLESAPAKTDFTISHIHSEEKRAEETEKELLIYDVWGERFLDDIVHLLSGIVRRLYLAKGKYAVHGACAALPEKNVLIVGHSGAGKTSSLLELLKHDEVRIYSGNKTVVSFEGEQLQAIAGTPTITVRSVDAHLYETLGVEQPVEHWGRHTFMLPPDRYTVDDKITIDAIVIVKLTNYTEKFAQLSYPTTVHTLYPYMMDAVNADVVMAEHSTVFGGAASSDVRDRLVAGLGAIAPSVPVYTATGPVEFVVDKLMNI